MSDNPCQLKPEYLPAVPVKNDPILDGNSVIIVLVTGSENEYKTLIIRLQHDTLADKLIEIATQNKSKMLNPDTIELWSSANAMGLAVSTNPGSSIELLDLLIARGRQRQNSTDGLALNRVFPPHLRTTFCRWVLTHDQHLDPIFARAFSSTVSTEFSADTSLSDHKHTLASSLKNILGMSGQDMARLVTGSSRANDLFVVWLTMSDIGYKQALLRDLQRPLSQNALPPDETIKPGRPSIEAISRRGSRLKDVGMTTEQVFNSFDPHLRFAISRASGLKKHYLTASEIAVQFNIRPEFIKSLVQASIFDHDTPEDGEVELFSKADAVAIYTAYAMKEAYLGLEEDLPYLKNPDYFRNYVDQQVRRQPNQKIV